MNREIPLFRMYWDEEDLSAVTDVIKRGTYWATGPEIAILEDRIAKYVGTRYAVTFNSGTSALHAMLLAYGVGEGDEVIVPSLTFIATANAALFVGARPVFAEVEGKTYGLDPEDVRKRITGKTRAIMPVHYGGCPCRHIKELKEIAEEYGLLLLEDAAAALGARVGSTMAGTFGDAAMFSFCHNKVITTGEGGVIVTDSKDIYEKLKLIVSHGRAESADYYPSKELMDYVALGYNFRMPTMNAALGVSQLNKVDKIINMRREKAKYYTSKLSGINGVKTWLPPDDLFNVYWLYTIEVEGGLRDRLKEYLAGEGVSSKVYYDLIHLTKFYREKAGFKEGDLPVTEAIGERLLSLPMCPGLTEEEIDYVVEKIDKFSRRM